MKNIQEILVVASRLEKWREAKKAKIAYQEECVKVENFKEFSIAMTDLYILDGAIAHDKKELAALLLGRKA